MRRCKNTKGLSKSSNSTGSSLIMQEQNTEKWLPASRRRQKARRPRKNPPAKKAAPAPKPAATKPDKGEADGELKSLRHKVIMMCRETSPPDFEETVAVDMMNNRRQSAGNTTIAKRIEDLEIEELQALIEISNNT